MDWEWPECFMPCKNNTGWKCTKESKPSTVSNEYDSEFCSNFEMDSEIIFKEATW